MKTKLLQDHGCMKWTAAWLAHSRTTFISSAVFGFKRRTASGLRLPVCCRRPVPVGTLLSTVLRRRQRPRSPRIGPALRRLPKTGSRRRRDRLGHCRKWSVWTPMWHNLPMYYGRRSDRQLPDEVIHPRFYKPYDQVRYTNLVHKSQSASR